MYRLSQRLHDKVRHSILITGSARSGTSIFGKLAGSLERVEYFFEPPTLFTLFTSLEALPEAQARLLFDTFVYEELLIGALSGRAINLRGQDDSSIRHTKTAEEIARRMEASALKRELDTRESEIAIKVPGFVYRLAQISQVLDLRRVCVLVREPESTMSSLLHRGWFSDDVLKAGDIAWPNRFDTVVPAPHWVPRDRLAEWDSMTEHDRAALYYITQTELAAVSAKMVVFDYQQMISQPRALLELVADRLGLAFGPCTDTLLNEVTVQDSTSRFDLKTVRKEFANRVPEVYAQATSHCVKL